VTDIQFVLVQDCIHSKEFYHDAHFVLLNYTCRATGKPDVKLNHEAQEFQWVTLADAKKLKLNRPTKVLLEATVEKAESGKAESGKAESGKAAKRKLKISSRKA
jgi:hypothetical protein